MTINPLSDVHAEAPLTRFLALIEPETPGARLSLIEAAVIATGGTLVRPATHQGEWPGSHLYEISLFGVLGRGTDALLAAQDWHKAASRMATPEAA